MNHPPVPPDDDRTTRDIRAALVFGVIAATIELAAILYFVFV
ncbi:MAG TPA: hypothetical protein VM033_07425 [Gemmatimonadaceae bacterium]|nr:hypothetical protein [Gemmatimonadaceae bacterium]